MPLNDLAAGGGTQLCGRECRGVDGARSCVSAQSPFLSAARRALDDAARRAVEVAPRARPHAAGSTSRGRTLSSPSAS